MPGPSKTPTLLEKVLGYFFAGVKELVNGYDSGGGLVKLPIWIAGASVTIAFAPFVIAGGGVFAILFFARAIYQERKKYKEEQDKIAEKSRLIRRSQLLDEELDAILKETLVQTKEIKRLLLKNRSEGKREEDIQFLVNTMIRQKISLHYSFIGRLANEDSNKELLKCLLRDYFSELSAYRYDSIPYHKLPKQNKILALIKEVTGFNPREQNFHQKMDDYLGDDADLKANFHRYIPAGTIPSSSPSFFARTSSALGRFIKNRKTLRYIGKKLLDFINDFGTGSGLVAATLTMFGIIVAGAPLTWPLIAAILAGGVAFGLISLAYQKVSGDRTRINMKSLNEEVKQQKIRVKLTQRLMKTKKNHSKFEDLDRYYDHHLSQDRALEGSNHRQEERRRLLQSHHSYKVPKSVYFRMALGIFGQIITAVSVAMIISLGIVWLATIFSPAIPLLVPTLGLGAVLSIFYIYRGVKAEVKSIKSELNQYAEVSEAKSLLMQKHANKPEVRNDLVKTKRQLLKELLIEYLKYVKNKGDEESKGKSGKYPKQEKVFTLIESVTGIQRPDGLSGEFLLTGDDKFYNQLAYYLKGNSKDAREANQLVQEFKNLFIPATRENSVNADAPEVKKKSGIIKKSANFVQEHLFTIIGAISLGLMVPLFLLGPQMIVVTTVASIVVVSFILIQFAAQQSKKNVKALDKEVAKYNLIERKQRLFEDNMRMNPNVEPVISATHEHTNRVLQRSHNSLRQLQQPRARTRFSFERTQSQEPPDSTQAGIKRDASKGQMKRAATTLKISPNYDEFPPTVIPPTIKAF